MGQITIRDQKQQSIAISSKNGERLLQVVGLNNIRKMNQ
jgi:hypothetical protein